MALPSMPPPFYGQLPYAYQPLGPVASSPAGSTDSSSNKPALTSAGNPTDVVDIRNRNAAFTAADNDLFSLGGLHTATAPSGGVGLLLQRFAVAAYQASQTT